jgi:hypothetical protein
VYGPSNNFTSVAASTASVIPARVAAAREESRFLGHPERRAAEFEMVESLGKLGRRPLIVHMQQVWRRMEQSEEETDSSRGGHARNSN